MSYRIVLQVALVLVCALLLPEATAQQPASEPEQVRGSLNLKVALVARDLSIRPVPKWGFLVTGGELPAEGLKVTTGFDGTAVTSLAVGEYRLTNPKAVEFEGNAFTWAIEFSIGNLHETLIEASQDNAQISLVTLQHFGGEVHLTEGELYRRLKDGVFLVESEFGRGSGFLIDKLGLVMTNSHVVHGSEYLAIQTTRREKYPATLVAEDPTQDVAILRVNPQAVAGTPVLKLAEDQLEYPPVSVGDRVLAIGSPLGTRTILTSGLVSKVEEGAIHSDVRIDHGSSGGPLFDMAGRVIGVTTFGQGNISGVIRIRVAGKVIVTAQLALASVPPPATHLAVEPDFSFPPDSLRVSSLTRSFDPGDYHLEVGKIDVQFITPVVIACQEVAAERQAAEFRERRQKKGAAVKEYEPGRDFFEWRRYLGSYRAVVTIQAVPEIGLTGGSIALAILAGVGGGPAPQMQLKFKTDFEKMELRRDGTLVSPIYPGRAAAVENATSASSNINDVAYYGVYEYPPEAFAPGAQLELRIWEQGRSAPRISEVDAEIVELIWSDFRPYFDALRSKAQEPTVDPVPQPAPPGY